MVLLIALTSETSGDLVPWVGSNYLMFALPHWVWTITALQLGISKAKIHGSLFGAHALLIAVSFIVLRSNVPEAANGWLLFWLGSPITIAVGALIGGQFARHRSHTT